MNKIRSILLTAMTVFALAYFVAPKFAGRLPFIPAPDLGTVELLIKVALAILFTSALLILIETFRSMKQVAEGLICIKRDSLLWRIAGSQKPHTALTAQIAISQICQMSWRVSFLLYALTLVPAIAILLIKLLRAGGLLITLACFGVVALWAATWVCGAYTLVCISRYLQASKYEKERLPLILIVVKRVALTLLTLAGVFAGKYVLGLMGMRLTWTASFTVLALGSGGILMWMFIMNALGRTYLANETQLEAATAKGEVAGGLGRHLCPLIMPCDKLNDFELGI